MSSMNGVRFAVMLALTATAWSGVRADTPTQPPTAAASSAKPSAPAAKSSTASSSPSTPAHAPAQKLDLAAPPINHVMSSEQVQSMLADNDELPGDSIDIQGDRVTSDVPVGQLRAVPWAIVHPLQAWRVLTPVPQ